MQITKCYCDLCGKEIPMSLDTIPYELKAFGNNYSICVNCADRLRANIEKAKEKVIEKYQIEVK